MEQVDADWLAKKKRLGPTERDLRVLSEPLPTVELRLFPGGGGGTGTATARGGLARDAEAGLEVNADADRVAYNRSFGLHCSLRPENMLPSYALELNARDIFGSALPQPGSGSGPGSSLSAVDQLVERISFMAMVERIHIS